MSANYRARTPGIATGLVLFWVQVYTGGLPGPIREHRLGQILSDLWEHYADRSEQGASPALIGLEALGRAARGAVADLFWRLQLEGPQVQINIPIERIAGVCLLLLTVGFMLSLNVSGYDPSVDGFDGEVRRLAGINEWQVGVYTALQVLAGIGMMVGAVVLYLTLRRYSTAPVILAAVAMAAAGLLTMVTSALYLTAAELADEYVAATPEHRDAVITVARAFVLMLTWMVPVTAFMLALSVGAFSVVSARHHLVPQWLRFAGVGNAAAFSAALVTDVVTDGDLAWGFFMLGFLLLLVWLLVAGAWLLLGGSTQAHDDQAPASPADFVVLGPSLESNHGQSSSLNRWVFGTMVPVFCASLLVGGVVGGLAGVPGALIVTLPAGVLLIAAIAYSRRRMVPSAPQA